MKPVVVISLPKCGTNLIAGVFRALGYAVTGEGVDNRFPSWCDSLNSDFITRFPEATCCVFHSLDVASLDGGLAHEWRRRGEPKVIFNYRDPRAALVSMINYLAGARYSGAGWQQIGADILDALPEDERVAFAIDYFEEPIFRKYRQSAWLLRHPHVLSASFERLVGPRGGGSADSQVEALARMLAFAGCDADPRELSGKVFDCAARTFFKGTVDGWRQRFGPSELALFRSRHGDILRTFGYVE